MTTIHHDTARLCEILMPLKKQGVSWEEAWKQCNVTLKGTQGDTWGEFVHDTLKAAYTNDDSKIKWVVTKQMSASIERDGYDRG